MSDPSIWKIVSLAIAALAVVALFWSLAKLIYHLAHSVFSIRKDRRSTAYLLGPFAFFRSELFEPSAQVHATRTAWWFAFFVAALVVVLLVYPFAT